MLNQIEFYDKPKSLMDLLKFIFILEKETKNTWDKLDKKKPSEFSYDSVLANSYNVVYSYGNDEKNFKFKICKHLKKIFIVIFWNLLILIIKVF
ncbi:MAG: ABC transporter ATPase component [Candidatus Phytoplasma asteris]|nr:MAG: hypothetical protein PLY_0500 [Periwinkle leaf yellowing phytoplasma]WEX19340.1 MAG: ABC transporter ATPase component [Candidatus Phytoplasma asteris]